MKLKCSRGCELDTNNTLWKDLKPNMECPNVISYDNVKGKIYCIKILEEVKEVE